MDPARYEFKQQEYLEEKLKPHLQMVLDIILNED